MTTRRAVRIANGSWSASTRCSRTCLGSSVLTTGVGGGSAMTDSDRLVMAEAALKEAREVFAAKLKASEAELARVSAELERVKGTAFELDRDYQRERAARKKAETERDQWHAAFERLKDADAELVKARQRAEQAESRLEQLRGEEAAERAARAVHAADPDLSKRRWEALSEHMRAEFVRDARAALEAALLERDENNKKEDDDGN